MALARMAKGRHLMHRKNWLLPALCLASTALAGTAAEEEVVRVPQSQGVLFATPLLSETEQADYRSKIRAATDASDRERIRSAHYELMKVRAKERGHALPEKRPAAAGVAGNAFGPQLITEEERAAQRARVRSAGSALSAEAIRPARREPAVEMALPVRQEQAVESSRRSGEVKPDAGAKIVIPSPPLATPSSPAMGAVVLPGIGTLFGPQLMTEEEKAAFRAKLRRAKSDEERQAIRAERDQQILLRTKEKGMTQPQ